MDGIFLSGDRDCAYGFEEGENCDWMVLVLSKSEDILWLDIAHNYNDDIIKIVPLIDGLSQMDGTQLLRIDPFEQNSEPG